MELLARWLLENPGLSVSIIAKPNTDTYGIPMLEVTMNDLRSGEAVNSKRFSTHQDVFYTDFCETLDRMKKRIELQEENWQ